MKDNIVIKNTRNSKIDFSVQLVKFLLSLLHLHMAKGKLFNLFKLKGIRVPNLTGLWRGLNEIMHGQPLPQCLGLREAQPLNEC